MSRFFSRRLTGLAPYVPGEQPRDMRYVKLNTNESPFPPAPGVLDAVDRTAVSQLNLYSDPTARNLESAIAARYGLRPAQVIAGNGSDEILAFAFQAFCDDTTGVCFADITYGFYPVYAQLYGIDARVMPLTESLEITPSDYFGAGRTVVLANPNAPTGICLPQSDVEAIVRANPASVVLVDEAYIDFGGESAAALVGRYDNLLVVMTYSKSRNMAGARIGFALGSEALIADLRTVKYSFNPYNLNRLSQLAGEAAMRDEDYFKRCTRAIIETREWAAGALIERGFSLTPSKTNFLFAKHPALPGRAYYEALKARGILVRHFAAPRIDAYVRITVGTREQMQALLDATDAIMKEGIG